MIDDTSPPPTRIAIPMPADLIARVDDWRFKNRIGSRAAAIRELIEVALTVKTKDQSK
jgi:metal-responsive CopG/Arc/MetJ family transcriptional regulator